MPHSFRKLFISKLSQRILDTASDLIQSHQTLAGSAHKQTTILLELSTEAVTLEVVHLPLQTERRSIEETQIIHSVCF